MMRLANRKVLVVGASAGVGRASGMAIAAEGGRVAFAARRLERLEQAATEAGEGSLAVACDVGNEGSCSEAVAAAADGLGGLDAIVYCPGVGVFEPIETIGAEAWRRTMDINLIGASLIMNAAIPHLEASTSEHRGKAVFISSIVIDDRPPRTRYAPYVVSKVALETLAQAWQGEHREVGFTTIAMADTVTEFGLDHDVTKLLPIVAEWDRLDYGYGRAMAAESVAAQVVNALASPETVRRIAITPRYGEAETMAAAVADRVGR